MSLSLAALTLAALTTAAPPERLLASERPITAAVAAADTSVFELGLLTTAQLEGFLAVSKALRTYWFADSAHKARYANLPRPIVRLYRSYKFAERWTDIHFIDYAALVKQDTAVAAIFKTNNFAPEQWAPTYMTVMRTSQLMATQDSTSDSTSVLGRNTALLKPYSSNVLQEAIGF